MKSLKQDVHKPAVLRAIFGFPFQGSSFSLEFTHHVTKGLLQGLDFVIKLFIENTERWRNDEYTNYIYWNRGMKDMKKYMKRRSSQLKTQLMQLRKKGLKKIQVCGIHTLRSTMPVRRSSQSHLKSERILSHGTHAGGNGSNHCHPKVYVVGKRSRVFFTLSRTSDAG